MRGKQIAVGLAAAGLVLSGCSEDEPVETSEALVQLSGREMCALLPVRDVKRAFDAKVELVGNSKRDTPPQLVSCGYAIHGTSRAADGELPNLNTIVRWPVGNKDAIDDAFGDARYQRVDGLGVAAGFGPGSVFGADGHKLVVLFGAGGERYQLGVGLTSTTTLKQLKPLAEKLLTGLQAQLS